MARSINPVHTQHDGDSIYALANGNVKADLNLVGTLAARAFAQAVKNAAYSAQDYRDLISASSINR